MFAHARVPFCPSLRALAAHGLSGALFGAFVGAAPLLLVMAGFVVWTPLFLWRTKRCTRAAEAVARFGMFVAVVALCDAAPLKPFDTARVGPFPRPTMTLGEIVTEGGMRRLHVPAGWEGRAVDVGSESISVNELLTRVRASTGLRAYWGSCGNGASILFGASPMGGITLSE